MAAKWHEIATIDETNSFYHKEHFNIKFVKIGWLLRKLWLKMCIFDFKINKMATKLRVSRRDK